MKRGRPLGSKNTPKYGGDLFIAIQALKEIADGSVLRESLKILGREWASVHPESEAFRWAQAYAKGALERLDQA